MPSHYHEFFEDDEESGQRDNIYTLYFNDKMWLGKGYSFFYCSVCCIVLWGGRCKLCLTQSSATLLVVDDDDDDDGDDVSMHLSIQATATDWESR